MQAFATLLFLLTMTCILYSADSFLCRQFSVRIVFCVDSFLCIDVSVCVQIVCMSAPSVLYPRSITVCLDSQFSTSPVCIIFRCASYLCICLVYVVCVHRATFSGQIIIHPVRRANGNIYFSGCQYPAHRLFLSNLGKEHLKLKAHII